MLVCRRIKYQPPSSCCEIQNLTYAKTKQLQELGTFEHHSFWRFYFCGEKSKTHLSSIHPESPPDRRVRSKQPASKRDEMVWYMYSIYTRNNLHPDSQRIKSNQPTPSPFLLIHKQLQGTVGKPAPSHVLQTRRAHSWFGESKEVLSLGDGMHTPNFTGMLKHCGRFFSTQVYPAFFWSPTFKTIMLALRIKPLKILKTAMFLRTKNIFFQRSRTSKTCRFFKDLTHYSALASLWDAPIPVPHCRRFWSMNPIGSSSYHIYKPINWGTPWDQSLRNLFQEKHQGCFGCIFFAQQIPKTALGQISRGFVPCWDLSPCGGAMTRMLDQMTTGPENRRKNWFLGFKIRQSHPKQRQFCLENQYVLLLSIPFFHLFQDPLA